MPKKVPMRKCVVCGKSFPKRELLRIVLDSENRPVADFTGKRNGRGMYLCFSGECKKTSKNVERALRTLDGKSDLTTAEEILGYLSKEIRLKGGGDENESI